MDYSKKIKRHYEIIWQNNSNVKNWLSGPYQELSSDFCVLEFEPTEKRKMWTYATCGMSLINDDNPIELHVFSREKKDSFIELLTIIAYYHRTKNLLNLWHTFDYGKPIIEKSTCSFGLISLPYLDGPSLENMEFCNKEIKFYWLIPITSKERDYKIRKGIEALELAFEKKKFNYLDMQRKSVI